MDTPIENKEKDNKEIENKDKEHAFEKGPMPMENVRAFLNPLETCLINAIKEFEKTPATETLDDIHMLFLKGNVLHNESVLETLPRMLVHLEKDEFYDHICLVLCDITHHNETVVSTLLDAEIYKKLDYSKKISISLVFNMCDGNKKAWVAFSTNIPSLKASNDDLIKILINNNE